MHSLRRAHRFARLVLAWFVLAVGVAVASPLVNPQSVALVCSAGGMMKFLPSDGEADGSPAASGLLDCPLCLHMVPPPAPRLAGGDTPPGFAGLSPGSEPFPAIRSAAPPPGRGPPAFS